MRSFVFSLKQIISVGAALALLLVVGPTSPSPALASEMGGGGHYGGGGHGGGGIGGVGVGIGVGGIILNEAIRRSQERHAAEPRGCPEGLVPSHGCVKPVKDHGREVTKCEPPMQWRKGRGCVPPKGPEVAKCEHGKGRGCPPPEHRPKTTASCDRPFVKIGRECVCPPGSVQHGHDCSKPPVVVIEPPHVVPVGPIPDGPPHVVPVGPAPEGGDVFIYIASHGMVKEDDAKQVYLLPVDAKLDDLDKTAYPLQGLYENLGKIGARTIMLMLEANFAKNLDELINPPNLPELEVEAMPVNPVPGLAVFKASDRDQKTIQDPEYGIGLFTRYLIGLAGRADEAPLGNGDKRIDTVGLYVYTADAVRTAARKSFGLEQKPLLSKIDNLVVGNLTSN
jgi:hypothetical protein